MERQKKIIDASVITKLFFEEEDSDKAFEIWKKHVSKEIHIFVPELMFSEVLNGLKYKKFNEGQLKEINSSLWNSGLKIEKTNNILLDKAIIIALNNNFTIYDSLYIALAEINNCELITADKELAKASNVKLLKEMQT
jgi:predicted nucleic acid-binding protein